MTSSTYFSSYAVPAVSYSYPAVPSKRDSFTTDGVGTSHASPAHPASHAHTPSKPHRPRPALAEHPRSQRLNVKPWHECANDAMTTTSATVTSALNPRRELVRPLPPIVARRAALEVARSRTLTPRPARWPRLPTSRDDATRARARRRRERHGRRSEWALRRSLCVIHAPLGVDAVEWRGDAVTRDSTTNDSKRRMESSRPPRRRGRWFVCEFIFVSTSFYALKSNNGLLFSMLDKESCKPQVARAGGVFGAQRRFETTRSKTLNVRFWDDRSIACDEFEWNFEIIWNSRLKWRLREVSIHFQRFNGMVQRVAANRRKSGYRVKVKGRTPAHVSYVGTQITERECVRIHCEESW